MREAYITCSQRRPHVRLWHTFAEVDAEAQRRLYPVSNGTSCFASLTNDTYIPWKVRLITSIC